MKKVIVVLFVFMFAFGGLIQTADAGSNTAYFQLNQYMRCRSSTWSYVMVYNYNTGSSAESNWIYGSYDLLYTVPYWAWKGIIIFDGLGQADEGYYFWDENY